MPAKRQRRPVSLVEYAFSFCEILFAAQMKTAIICYVVTMSHQKCYDVPTAAGIPRTHLKWQKFKE